MCCELIFDYYGLGCTHREHVDLIELCREAQQSLNEPCRPLAPLKTIPCWGECRVCRGAGPAVIHRYKRITGGQVDEQGKGKQAMAVEPSTTDADVHNEEDSDGGVPLDLHARARNLVPGPVASPADWAAGESSDAKEDPWKPSTNYVNPLADWVNEPPEGYASLNSVLANPSVQQPTADHDSDEPLQSLEREQRQRFSSEDEAFNYMIEESIKEYERGNAGTEDRQDDLTRKLEETSLETWIEEDQRRFSSSLTSRRPTNTTSKGKEPELLADLSESPVEEQSLVEDQSFMEEEQDSSDSDDLYAMPSRKGSPGLKAEAYDEEKAMKLALESSERELAERKTQKEREGALRVDSVRAPEKSTPPEDDDEDLYSS